MTSLPLLRRAVASTLATAALLALGLPATAWSQPRDTLQKIRETGVISLGGRDASFPFSYKVSAEGPPIGYSADLCQKVVDAVKAKLSLPQLKVEYTMVTPSNRIALVQNGTIDLECGTTTHTLARAQQVDFAPSHFVASIAVATRKDSGISQMNQLDSKTVATVTGSTSIQLLRAWRRNEQVQFTELSGKDTADTFLLLSNGRAQAMILEDVQLAGLIARSASPGEYMILTERLREEPYAFMLRKGDVAFKALVDETLTRVMKNGEAADLYAKWFTRPVPPSGVNLAYPMPAPVKDALSRPAAKGI